MYLDLKNNKYIYITTNRGLSLIGYIHIYVDIPTYIHTYMDIHIYIYIYIYI